MQEIDDRHHTPHLVTALSGPLHLLEKKLLNNQNQIESWFQSQWQLSPAPVYGSVDLRNSGFKLAPIDMNLFPGGFNNLNLDFLPLSVEAASQAILQYVPAAKKILLIPESHTRNLLYWENISLLLKILSMAGFEVRVGVLDENLPDIILQNSERITLNPCKRKANIVYLDDFYPDLILLNNDLSAGIPKILNGLDQPILPPAQLGWSRRLKSGHFQHYAEVSAEFSKLIDIDPWLIAPLFRHCGEINFMKPEAGNDCLSYYAEQLFSEIQKKYDEYKINCKPFIIVKADAGTYGMAVMTLRSLDEIHSLNRKERTRMSKSKGGQLVTRVIIQEGVYTFETIGEDEAVSEPVVYLWGKRVVGGFYRVHKERGVDENLNSPGMQFEPLAFASPCQQPGETCLPHEKLNRFYAYGVIARLSMLAAAREIVEQKNNEKDSKE